MFTYVSSGQNKININEKEKIKLTPVYIKKRILCQDNSLTANI